MQKSYIRIDEGVTGALLAILKDLCQHCTRLELHSLAALRRVELVPVGEEEKSAHALEHFWEKNDILRCIFDHFLG
jgi:hypothetical protein